MSRKFKIGDKVRVKDTIKIEDDDIDGVKETIGKIGTITKYYSGGKYPYKVEFDECDDMEFAARELEKVEDPSKILKVGDKVKVKSEFIAINNRFKRFGNEVGTIVNIWQNSVFAYGVKFASYTHPKYFKARELERVGKK